MAVIFKGLAAMAMAAAGLAATGTAAAADAYPTRPVTMVVPFGPGGSADVYARYLAQRLQQELGQTFVVENRPGAGAQIGTQYVAKAAPDGYTLLVMSNTQTVNETLVPTRPYNLLTDFVAVAPINDASLVLVANEKFQAANLQELIAAAKQAPGRLNYSSSGTGTPYHIAGELLNSMAGIDVEHVPYKSSGQARSAVVGGEVNYMFDSIATMASLVEGKRVRALATTGQKRSQVLPDVPTMAEAGLPGYSANLWLGLLAPAGTPQDIVARLNAAIGKIVTSPDVQAAWAKDGVEPLAMDPQAFAAYLKADIDKLGRVVREAGMKAE